MASRGRLFFNIATLGATQTARLWADEKDDNARTADRPGAESEIA